MTVYKKIVKITPADSKNPEREIDQYLKKNPGIDYNLLQKTPAIGVAVFEFSCSDNNPSARRDMKDIDKLISSCKLTVIKEMDTHREDPSKKANAIMQISDDKDQEIERG